MYVVSYVHTRDSLTVCAQEMVDGDPDMDADVYLTTYRQKKEMYKKTAVGGGAAGLIGTGTAFYNDTPR